jgi:hypothetical protein
MEMASLSFRRIAMKTKGGPWAAEEDAVVLTMDARAAAKKLGRTYGAVNTRRHTLRHPEPKPPARLNPIEIAVDVQLQQDRGMI